MGMNGQNIFLLFWEIMPIFVHLLPENHEMGMGKDGIPQ